jgi:hypothetical protein
MDKMAMWYNDAGRGKRETMYTDTNIHLCDIDGNSSNSLSEVSVEEASSKNAPLNG